MNKIFIIIHREFMNRVSKKSFIILTILMPFVFAALIFVPLWLSMVKSGGQEKVVVVDNERRYLSEFRNNESYYFVPGDSILPEYKTDTTSVAAVVLVTGDLLKDPSAVTVYSHKEIPPQLTRLVEDAVNTRIRHDKLLTYNIPNLTDIMSDYDKDYAVRTVKWTPEGGESESNAGVAIAAGMILTFIIFMFVMSYGGMVMQSVMEEKTNRIVEIMVSSVRPFQLLMGKIIGIGLVGILQLAIWGLLLFVLLSVASAMVGANVAQSVDPAVMGAPSLSSSDEMVAALQSIHSLNLGKLLVLFVLNFIGGYLIYASIFAAIGASINTQEDSSQFMTPIMFLLMFAFYAGVYSADNPDGPLAVWCSMIPFSSPVVMMVRLPMGAPMWQVVISVVLLYATAVVLIWMASKIYRVGILMYGKKPSFMDMIRWIRYK